MNRLTIEPINDSTSLVTMEGKYEDGTALLITLPLRRQRETVRQLEVRFLNRAVEVLSSMSAAVSSDE